mmetsp:Transcript_65279/g.164570  ORF Transcript_65279/g.164570 Transcript_65279/m.164570 type:complete len:254 (+) Transcript_65279:67-828(+)
MPVLRASIAPAMIALLGGLLISLTGAGDAACRSSATKGCVAVGSLLGDEDGALAMLQHKVGGSKALAAASSANSAANKKRKHKMPNATAVWEQLKGAVEIDELKAQIQNATDSETIQHLQEKLNTLTAEFPSYEEIQQQFSDQWANITQAVDLENLQDQLEEAKKYGSSVANATVAELQKQYDALKEQMPDFDLDSIQQQAADLWSQMEDYLPDLDSLTAQAQQVANQAMDAAADAANSAANAISDALNGIFR